MGEEKAVNDNTISMWQTCVGEKVDEPKMEEKIVISIQLPTQIHR